MNKELIIGNQVIKPLLPIQSITETTTGAALDLAGYAGPAGVVLDTAIGTPGSSIATNGAFAADTIWTWLKGPGWTISGGKAHSDGTQTGTSDLAQINSLCSSQEYYYFVQFTVSNYVSGTVTPVIHGGAGTARSANGTFAEVVYSGTNSATPIVLRASADFVGSIDGFVIKTASIGQYLNTNYGFGADVTWVKGTGWTISAGVADCDGAQTDVSDISQTVTVTAGVYYSVYFTVSSYSAGTITPMLCGTAGTARSADGTYREVILAGTATPNTLLARASDDFVGKIDNFYLQVGGADAATDGVFNDDSNWYLGSGWAMAGTAPDYAACSGTHTASSLAQNLAITAGKSYSVTFTLASRSAGSVTPRLGGTAGTTRSVDGTYTELIIAGSGSNPKLEFYGSADFAGRISAVSVAGMDVTVTLEESSDNSTYTSVPGCAFAPADHSAASLQKMSINLDERKRYLRAIATLSGDGASMYLSCNMLALPE